MQIIPKLSDEAQIQEQFFRNFIFYGTALKNVQNIQKPRPPRALFTTVHLCVK